MKRVFTNSMVCHVWAQQTQPVGRNSTGSIWFEGDTIYSYGSHFPIARFVATGKPDPATVVFFTTRNYSMTTAHHKSLVHRAIPSYARVYHVDFPQDPPILIVRSLEAKAVEAFESSQAPRLRQATRDKRVVEAKAYRDQRDEIAALFDVVVEPAVGDAGFVEFCRGAVARREAAQAESDRITAEKQAKVEAERAADTMKWLAGETDQRPWWVQHPLLRVNGNRIETSMGAEIPLRVAPAVWDAVQMVVSKGEAQFVGIEVGNFKITEITGAGTVVAGCHRIPYNEIERIAGVLGYTQEVAA